VRDSSRVIERERADWLRPFIGVPPAVIDCSHSRAARARILSANPAGLPPGSRNYATRGFRGCRSLSRSYLGQVLRASFRTLAGFPEEKWSGAIRDTRLRFSLILLRFPPRDAEAEIPEREQREREREREDRRYELRSRFRPMFYTVRRGYNEIERARR